MVSVKGWYPMIDDPSVCVELRIRVHMHVRLAFCSIEDVCHSQLKQTCYICGYRPVEIQV